MTNNTVLPNRETHSTMEPTSSSKSHEWQDQHTVRQKAEKTESNLWNAGCLLHATQGIWAHLLINRPEKAIGREEVISSVYKDCYLSLSFALITHRTFLISSAFHPNTKPTSPNQFTMKSFLSILTLTSAAFAASVPTVFQRDALAICNAHRGESCPQSGQFGCENNGGHSVRENKPLFPCYHTIVTNTP